MMLNTQYRMLPQVSQFPSDMFYNSKLIDGENVKMPFYAPSYLDVTNSDDSLGNCNGTFLKPFIFLTYRMVWKQRGKAVLTLTSKRPWFVSS